VPGDYSAGVKILARLLFCLALASFNTAAQTQRVFSQAELDAMLAPIALYPDALVSQILTAAIYPEHVADAARWSRANPHLRGDEAVRAVQGMPWDSSVKELVALPELLSRMDESPQWTRDLGDAYLAQEPHVLDTIQSLRRRAQANGNLRSTDRQSVYTQGDTIVVQPAHPQIVYLYYYDPFVVYGPWWWHAYRPVYWRPWPTYRVFFAAGHHWHWGPPQRWSHRLAPRVQRATPVAVPVRPAPIANRPAAAPEPRRARNNGAPSPAARMQQQQLVQRTISQPHVAVPEALRRPIVNSAPQIPVRERRMPAAHGYSPRRDAQRGKPDDHRREARHQRNERRG